VTNPQTELLSYRGLLGDAERALDAAGVATPRLDADVLLATAMRRDRAGLYAHLGDAVNDDVLHRFWTMIRRRERRQPVAYITGVREFWSIPFIVTPAVLIPRPETELIVQAACEILAERRDPVVCDLGTGSGCIAIALACEHPTVRVVATDISLPALRIARRNAIQHGVEDRVQLVCTDLFEAISASVDFDLVVSNPPYVPVETELMTESSYEPQGALFGGQSGMDTIRRILPDVRRRLRDSGHLVMEFGDGQGDDVRQMAAASDLTPIEIRSDLAGIPRVLLARCSGGLNG
jgi:release factor glutamine methyltransferase